MNHLRSTLFFVVLSAAMLMSTPAAASSIQQPETRHVDLVIALDVSGSMSGLIESAKQRLWDMVNDFGQARPQPVLRVAIITFGNPSYGEQTGYVRIDQPFTSDLDRVNQTLFSFTTNGGDEYVARAVNTAIQDLQWSPQSNALKVVFVAGNESASQDPEFSLNQVGVLARGQDIVINALYCGGPQDTDSVGWAQVANLTQGMFASIDQNAAAVANIATPMDAEIARLNQALNETYVAYGAKGKAAKENQLAQDEAVAGMSAPAAASRAVTKASKLYDSRDWDLVDAVESGVEMDAVPESELPEELQALTDDERTEYVRKQGEKRDELKQEIGKLDRERRAYIADEKAKSGNDDGLDTAIKQGLRKVAEARGFVFAEPED